MILRVTSTFALFVAMALACACTKEKHEDGRELLARMDDLADRYYQASSIAAKEALQREVLATLAKAEEAGVLKDSPRYYAQAREFTHLRLCRLAHEAGDAARAHYHRAQAAEIDRVFSIGALGGIDLFSPATLPEIAQKVARMDTKLAP